MMTLKQVIADAEARGAAVGHFNISNIEALHGIFNAARKLNLPVIIGVSEGERDFIGVKEVVALVKSLRENNQLNGEPYPIFLNADHTYSLERVKEVVDAGFDAVIYDGAKLPVEENIKTMKQCVEYAKSVNPNIIVEGELGYIGQSSKMLDEIPEGAGTSESFTKPEDAAHYVQETGIDLFSPAVGNLHGMLKNMPNPRLDIERVKAVRAAAGVPLVLHGGSGIMDEDFVAAIKAGISTIHINTEIRVAYRDALKLSLQQNPDEVAPYKFLKPGILAVEAVVEKRLRLFNNL
ncbi:MAG: class II fructose-bisphosphate aldolase [bacterium]